MTKVRKPIPKTQKELSNEQVIPTYPQYGDPNDFIQTPLNNRALNTSFKGDTTKPFSVGIQDIDEAIYYYFQNVVQPSVTQNGARLNVPIIYGSPEKWKSFQKDGYYRDQKGKIMAPLIMFKKTDITKNRQIANKLDANYPNNFGVFTKEYTQRNAYDNFKVLSNRKPQKQYYAVVMPDYLTVTYECAVFTYYVEQLNKIVESMEYASDAYWGDPQRYQFKASIDSFGFQTELAQEDERIVRSTFTLKINGYIIPEILQKDVTALKKFSNITKTTFTLEDEPTTSITEAPLPPVPVLCAPGTVLNSDSTYNSSVNSGGTLILPDSQINVNSVDSGDVVSVKTIDVNLEDSLGAPVVPTSVGLVGNTLTIEVPTGGTPTGDYLVRFFDIDGTILKEEYVNAGNSATAPANPTYDSTYLTFDGWNNSFTNIQHDLDVGAIYDTIDGKTYLFLKVTTVTGLQPTLQLNKSTTALLTINWGDATTNTTTSSGNVNITKTAAYSSVGDYVVSIECAANYGVNTSTGFILGNNTTYSRTLIKAYVGANVNTLVEPFRNNIMLEILSLPNNLTSLSPNFFTGAASLRHFNMPSSVTSFSILADGCRRLKSISLSQGNTTIQTASFRNCNSLQRLILPDATTTLVTNSFAGCSSLSYIYLPSSCTTIETTSFFDCRSLRTISLPNNVFLGQSVFESCLSLESITLPTGATNTGGSLFRTCSSLASCNIPNTITAIQNQLFDGCVSLKELEFHNAVTSVGVSSFLNASQILEYTFLSTTPPTLANTNAFNGINAACKIYVPDANVAAYKAATNWSAYANYIYPLSTKP
jgi:hypothetical protein